MDVPEDYKVTTSNDVAPNNGRQREDVRPTEATEMNKDHNEEVPIGAQLQPTDLLPASLQMYSLLTTRMKINEGCGETYGDRI